MDKSPDAFRTISEVAEVLDTPAHVLRFWESRFPQIRPVKRAGGRRYYRPADVALLLGIKHLLHDQGLTIRGVQKILREQGVRHVSDLSGHSVTDDSESAESALEAALVANFGIEPEAEPLAQEQIETAQVVALEGALRQRAAASDSVEVAEDPAEAAEVLPLFDNVAPLSLAESAVTLDSETEFDGTDGVKPPQTTAPAPAASETPRRQDLLARLRALPPGGLNHPDAHVLMARLSAMKDRMQALPPQAPL